MYDANVEFEKYTSASLESLSEAQTMARIVNPIFGFEQGQGDMQDRNVSFTNLDPLTSTYIPPAKPDIVDGAKPSTLHETVRRDEHKNVVPLSHTEGLFCPNMTLEAKGADGIPRVLATQARRNGAPGARSMHSLVNYGQNLPIFDQRARTYRSTFSDGQFRLFATHTAPSKSPQRPVDYHQTYLGTRTLLKSPQSMVNAIGAVRNMRDLARTDRMEAIEAASLATSRIYSRAPRHRPPAPTSCAGRKLDQDDDSDDSDYERSGSGSDSDSDSEAEAEVEADGDGDDDDDDDDEDDEDEDDDDDDDEE